MIFLELIRVFESMSPGRFKALLLAINYSLKNEHFCTCITFKYAWFQSKFNFESFWHLVTSWRIMSQSDASITQKTVSLFTSLFSPSKNCIKINNCKNRCLYLTYPADSTKYSSNRKNTQRYNTPKRLIRYIEGYL